MLAIEVIHAVVMELVPPVAHKAIEGQPPRTAHLDVLPTASICIFKNMVKIKSAN